MIRVLLTSALSLLTWTFDKPIWLTTCSKKEQRLFIDSRRVTFQPADTTSLRNHTKVLHRWEIKEDSERSMERIEWDEFKQANLNVYNPVNQFLNKLLEQ